MLILAEPASSPVSRLGYGKTSPSYLQAILTPRLLSFSKENIIQQAHMTGCHALDLPLAAAPPAAHATT
jgi:hypothetical protein